MFHRPDSTRSDFFSVSDRVVLHRVAYRCGYLVWGKSVIWCSISFIYTVVFVMRCKYPIPKGYFYYMTKRLYNNFNAGCQSNKRLSRVLTPKLAQSVNIYGHKYIDMS